MSMSVRDTRPRPGSPAAPANDDRLIQSRRCAGRGRARRAPQWLRANWANLSLSGSVRATIERGLAGARASSRRTLANVSMTTPAAVASAERPRATTLSSAISMSAAAPSGTIVGDVCRVTGLRVRLDLVERAPTQVDVQREEVVRLDRQLVVQRERGQTVVEEPFRLLERRRKSGGRDSSPAKGSFSASAMLPRNGVSRYPSAPSISSFTRRLNSMAYSIGSSLVKTSRKPWTTRFCASFSDRPRLIR